MRKKSPAGRHPREIHPSATEGHRLFREFCVGVNLAELARMAGVTREMIRQLAAGITAPGIETAYKIETASYGKIPIVSWVQPAKETEAA